MAYNHVDVLHKKTTLCLSVSVTKSFKANHQTGIEITLYPSLYRYTYSFEGIQ